MFKREPKLWTLSTHLGVTSSQSHSLIFHGDVRLEFLNYQHVRGCNLRRLFCDRERFRVQDFHTRSCEEHVHISHCGVRRIGYTGLGEIMQNIAWELDVLRVMLRMCC